jgi:hypothetical protein
VAWVGWNISSLADGEYDIVIHVGCEASKSPVPSSSVTFSSIAKLLLDRNAPVEFAQHARPTGPYYPGDDISIAFNEAIVSSGISVMGKVSDGTTLGQNDLLLSHSDNSVFIDFSPSMTVLVRLHVGFCCFVFVVFCVVFFFSCFFSLFCFLVVFGLFFSSKILSTTTCVS